MFSIHAIVDQGDAERAEAELRKKKEHKEALERETRLKKQEVELEAHEAVNVREEGMQIPVQVDDMLTHKSLAIYEMIREGLFDRDPPLEPSQRVEVVYQNFFSNPPNHRLSLSLGHLAREGKPILYQCDTTVENRDASHVQHQKPPVWWEQCSAQLQSACQAGIPEKDVPSSYVTKQQIVNRNIEKEKMKKQTRSFNYFPTTKVFTDQHVQDAFSCFDWLSVQADQLSHHFPEPGDAAVIKSLRSLTIHRYAKDSNVIGNF